METTIRHTILTVILLAGIGPLAAQDRPLPPPAAELKALDWMLGSWKHDAEGAVLKIDGRKSGGGYFIERTFQLRLGQNRNLTLRQFIGWNPAAKQIQSWAFGSDGSFETGTWSKEGSTWQAERSITYADGTKGSALNLTTVIDKNNLMFKSVERRFGDQILPDIMDLEVQRSK